jgi:hypothetical protein
MVSEDAKVAMKTLEPNGADIRGVIVSEHLNAAKL